MNGLIALGAGIAALTGIGGGIGIGIATGNIQIGEKVHSHNLKTRLPARSRPTCCWVLLWPKVLQFSVSSLHC